MSNDITHINKITAQLPDETRSLVEARLVTEAEALVQHLTELEKTDVEAGQEGLAALEAGNVVSIDQMREESARFLSALKPAANPMPKARVITQPAKQAMYSIASYIALDSHAKAEQYLTAALDTLEAFDEKLLSARAHPVLPPSVHILEIPGFTGYLLRIVVTDDSYAVVAVISPRVTQFDQVRAAGQGAATNRTGVL